MARKEPRLTKHGPSRETVRLSTDFYDHPKALAAGPQVAYLFLLCLMWSGRHGTGGFIPDTAIEPLARLAGLEPGGNSQSFNWVTEKLTGGAELCVYKEHGLQVEDWDEWQEVGAAE